MAIALPFPTLAECLASTIPQTSTMTVREMLAQGMTRDQVAQALVQRNTVSTIKGAQILIAFALGETTGDLRHIEERDPDAVIRRLGTLAADRLPSDVDDGQQP